MEGVAGQDRHRLTVFHVAGGASPAQVVVIDCRQIVVDQGEGLDHLQRAGERQDICRPTSDRLGGSDTEQGPQTLAAGE